MATLSTHTHTRMDATNLIRQRLGLPPLKPQTTPKEQQQHSDGKPEDEDGPAGTNDNQEEEEESNWMPSACGNCNKCQEYLPTQTSFASEQICRSCGCNLIHHLPDDEFEQDDDEDYEPQYGGFDD